jgi:hypothetical protein
MILVGSQAATFSGIDLGRTPQKGEYDLIVPGERLPALLQFASPIAAFRPIDKNHAAIIGPPTMDGGRILDLELAWPDSSGAFLLYLAKVQQWPTTHISFGDLQIECQVAPPHVLLAMKLSHRYKKNSPHFLKTMNDIRVLRRHTMNLAELYALMTGPWFKQREAETYTYRHPSLKQNKKEFFSDDGIKYVYDHDDIHRVVAEPLRPAYLSYSADGQEVFSSRELFEACDIETRLRGVFEETCVLALERSQIPFRNKNIDPRVSFEIALQKVCTSITSGWFREFAWEHFDTIRSMYNPRYVEKFFEQADEGMVKPYVRAA